MAHHIHISGRRISADDPCYVIAEIGVNHNGDIGLAHAMIDAAKAAGADAVKFQTYRTDALVVSTAAKAAYQVTQTGGGSQSDMLRALELRQADFAALKAHCDTAGVDFLSTAFDPQSLDEVIGLGPACLKWPSGELNNTPLLRQAAGSGLPILLSTGMGSVAEIATAIDLLAEQDLHDVCILQCVSNYPARIEDQNLRVIPTMSGVFGKPVGFSDHTKGPFAALAARGLGMAVLEKHFTMDRTMAGPDHTSSIEPAEFGQMVQVLRQVEIGLGDGIKRMVASERGTLSAARKSLVFAMDLPAGHVVTVTNILAKRPGTGLSPPQIDIILGRTLTRDVEADEMVQLDHVR